MIKITKTTNMAKKMNIEEKKNRNCENNVIFLLLIISALQTKCILKAQNNLIFPLFSL